ncbi:MAG: hypothetical protein WBB19_18460 [Desulforhopalus sp.]
MSEEIIKYLSYEEAANLVGAIQEEEDIEVTDRRILTVYSKDDKELCWFDFLEVKAAVGEVEAGDRKAAVQRYILNRIPDWVLDL